MLDIALHQREGEPVLLRDIAERQRISERYLEQVISSLRNAGLLKSVRGARGGYYLARPSSRITVLEIFQATSGSLQLLECLEEEFSCDRTAQCASRVLWSRLHQAMRKTMEGTTLEDLVKLQEKLQEEMGRELAPMYHI
jgi:Rrf2 family protein